MQITHHPFQRVDAHGARRMPEEKRLTSQNAGQEETNMQDIIAGLELPAGIHAEVLTDVDAATGSPINRVVVWADRAYGKCPRCSEPVDRVPGCPAVLSGGEPGGQLIPYSQQHGCGEVLSVDWQATDGGVAAEGVLAVARDLARDLADKTVAARRRITRELREDLTSAILRLGDGEPEEDICTGSETSPGVYREDGTLIAWAYGPAGDEDIITVTEHDVREAADD